MSEPVADLAEEIAQPDAEPATTMRVGIVTAVETTGSRRVQLDIGGDAWINRVQDCQLAVGDRVSALQQGPVLLVIGRLEGTDAFTPVGSVLPYAGSAAPTNWLLCDGSAVSRSTYAGLFAVCGTTYGAGNGSTTFNLPNLSNRLPMGAGGTYTRGSTGSGQVTLSEANMPTHDHTFSGSATSGGDHGHSLSGSVGSGGGHSHSGDGAVGSRSDLLAGGGTGAATNAGTGSTSFGGDHSHSLSGSANSAGSHSHSVSGTVGNAGSGTPFTTTGPYIALQYIIRAL